MFFLSMGRAREIINRFEDVVEENRIKDCEGRWTSYELCLSSSSLALGIICSTHHFAVSIYSTQKWKSSIM